MKSSKDNIELFYFKIFLHEDLPVESALTIFADLLFSWSKVIRIQNRHSKPALRVIPYFLSGFQSLMETTISIWKPMVYFQKQTKYWIFQRLECTYPGVKYCRIHVGMKGKGKWTCTHRSLPNLLAGAITNIFWMCAYHLLCLHIFTLQLR